MSDEVKELLSGLREAYDAYYDDDDDVYPEEVMDAVEELLDAVYPERRLI